MSTKTRASCKDRSVDIKGSVLNKMTIVWWVRRLMFFFFSSRRRHTRFDCDWSSDVCSSDLGDRTIRTRVLDLIKRTELNAVVIDVKGDRGWIVYPTNVIEALTVGAQGPATLRDFDALMRDLKARGIYTIARIVAFKDNILATRRPDLAIIDTRTGQPWTDNEKLAWVDPFREEVWDYNLEIGRASCRE